MKWMTREASLFERRRWERSCVCEDRKEVLGDEGQDGVVGPAEGDRECGC
jgi:hypothetical protein